MTKQKKTYVCQNCKTKVNAVDFYKAENLCSTCYDNKRDNNFSSQSELSDKLFDIQQQEEWEHNELLNKEEIKDNDIKYFFDKYWVGKIMCRNCSYIRTSWKCPETPMTEKSKELRIKNLKKKCPKCGLKGYLVRI